MTHVLYLWKLDRPALNLPGKKVRPGVSPEETKDSIWSL